MVQTQDGRGHRPSHRAAQAPPPRRPLRRRAHRSPRLQQPQRCPRDLTRALEAHRDEEAAEVGIYRQQENERLDELLEAAWPRATQPSPVFDKEGNLIGEELDMRAVDTVLRLMDRRAKLNGLDMPAKAEITGANGGPLQMSQASDAELEAIMNAGPAPAPNDDEDAPGEQPGDSSG
jgi:hypothetical protein